jgi:small-conductance mechanosensitive channel
MNKITDTKWWHAAHDWFEGGVRAEWAVSLLGVGVMLMAYFIMRLVIQKKQWETEQKRQVMTQGRNILWGLMAIWLIMAWSKMLVPFLFSIVALLVALVMATKEWILCLLGAIYRYTTGAYQVGDRIRINGVRGEVIDIHWMQTRLLESGPAPDGTYYTGNVHSFPNAWLLTHPLNNESFFESYTFHWLKFPLSVADNLEDASRILLDEATKACEPFLADAHQYLKGVQHSHFLEAPSVKPKLHVEFERAGEIQVNVRYLSPKGKNNDIAQQIMMGFLSRYRLARHEKWEEGGGRDV